ncbi:unnamed protein product [Cylindrotheca closterium]|uniref:Uncharacterized protein n=1 Tax=Cylindrotheca closterium TaxID=2856 RepID=A0AAD2FF53_9STRA|nr:unnamed protein product [Cylindrotheca closterium]
MHWRRQFAFSLLARSILLADCLVNLQSCQVRCSPALETSNTQQRSGFRPTQTRKNQRGRKPRGYWKNIENIEKEIRTQWISVNVNIPSDQPPPIPNESLLNYWERNDLRYAIYQFGGREFLSAEMNGAFLVPGKWKEASEIEWVKELIQNDKNLDPEIPPLSPQQAKLKKREDPMEATESRQRKRWIQRSERKKKGFWRSEEVVIDELYKYLSNRRDTRDLPAVWMPRGNELNDAGRNDLHQAIARFGGPKAICKKAGLIPSREWHYMEGLHELMIELRAYCDEFFDGDYSIFPTVSGLDEQGYGRLKSLIGYFGGQRFVAKRLGMMHVSSAQDGTNNPTDRISYGKFDLEFGIQLFEFVRQENMKKSPPLQFPIIAMPTFRDILRSDDDEALKLDSKIGKYGGYENVARRMGLAFAPSNPQ